MGITHCNKMTNIKKTAKKVEKMGRCGDTVLAHIKPSDARLLKKAGGSGRKNPKTGLREYNPFYDMFGSGKDVNGEETWAFTEAGRQENREANKQAFAEKAKQDSFNTINTNQQNFNQQRQNNINQANADNKANATFFQPTYDSPEITKRKGGIVKSGGKYVVKGLSKDFRKGR